MTSTGTNGSNAMAGKADSLREVGREGYARKGRGAVVIQSSVHGRFRDADSGGLVLTYFSRDEVLAQFEVAMEHWAGYDTTSFMLLGGLLSVIDSYDPELRVVALSVRDDHVVGSFCVDYTQDDEGGER